MKQKDRESLYLGLNFSVISVDSVAIEYGAFPSPVIDDFVKSSPAKAGDFLPNLQK
jgi:hypothetical protein